MTSLAFHTSREIAEQPQVWEDTIQAISRLDAESVFRPLLEGDEVLFAGCGSSYYLALSAAAAVRHVLGVSAKAVPSSDILIFGDSVFLKGRRYGVIAVSRSGETTETVVAAREARRRGIRVLAVSCEAESTLVQEADTAVIIDAARESSVVMTQSFTSMLLSILCLATKLSGDQEALSSLEKVPAIGRSVLASFEGIVDEVVNGDQKRHFVLLGSGPYYGLACEGMLKLREMARETAEAYHPLEFRHGPVSAVDESTLIVSLASMAGWRYETDLLADMKELGARILVVSPRGSIAADSALSPDFTVRVEAPNEIARLVAVMPVVQTLACRRAVARGVDPDSPRNLSRVVRL